MKNRKNRFKNNYYQSKDQTRKDLRLAFLISVRNMKDYQGHIDQSQLNFFQFIEMEREFEESGKIRSPHNS